MKSGLYETPDIFKSASFVCMGAHLEDVIVKNNGKKVVYFLIKGKNLNKLDNDYMSGRALVNPVQFRESLNWLRDLLFEKLRGNGGRYDRPDKDRGHKTKY